MQSPNNPVLPMVPPRMGTANFRMPGQAVSARPVFRRQNTASRGIKQSYQSTPQAFKPTPMGAGAPMVMPRFATSSVIGSNNMMSQPKIPMPEKRQVTQARLVHPNVTRTAVMPLKRQVQDSTPKTMYSYDNTPSGMPRQDTGMSQPGFVPQTYVTSVYPPRDNMFQNRTPTNNINMVNRPRTNTAVFSPPGQNCPQSPAMSPGHVAFKGRNHSKANALQRQPSMFNEVINRIKENTPSLPKIETKEAVQLVGGFVSGTLGVLAHIVGDIRGDIINGLFKTEDPSYDAAKAYYYAANNHPPVPTGLTQRIDYIEEIEKCTMNRAPSVQRTQRGHMTQRLPPQPVYRPQPPTQQTFQYEPQYYEPAPQPKVMQQPKTFGQDPHMFSMMSERTLEEFLMNDGYLNSAPPSIPR